MSIVRRPTSPSPPGAPRAIRLLQWWKILLGCYGLGSSTFVLYYAERGFTVGATIMLHSVLGLAYACLQLPTGYLADRIGRKRTLTLATTMMTLGAGLLFVSRAPAGVIAGDVLFGAGYTFALGADQALVFESLADEGQELLFPSFWSRCQAFGMTSLALMTVGGSFLAARSLALPWIIITAALVVALLLIAQVREPGRKRGGAPRRPERIGTILKRSLVKDRRRRWLLLFHGFLGSLLLGGYWLYQPYLADVGIEVEYFGAIYAGAAIFGALSTRLAPSIARSVPERALATISVVGMAATYLLLASGSGSRGSALLVVVPSALGGIASLTYSVLLTKATTDEERATVASLQVMIGQLGGAGLALVVGTLVEAVGVSGSFLFLAGATLIGGGVLLVGFFSGEETAHRA